jgi:hypothetical protein
MTTTLAPGPDATAVFRETIKQCRGYPPSGRLANCEDKIAAISDFKKALIQWCLARPGYELDNRGLLAYNFLLSGADYAEIFGLEQPLLYPPAPLLDLAANASHAAVFLGQKEQSSRRLVITDIGAVKAIITDQAGALLDPLRHAYTGLGLVTPAQMWNLLDAQYGLAAISTADIARWYASTQVHFDRSVLLSVNIFRDAAAYTRVTELLGVHHALSQMQMLLQLSEKSSAYHVTAASWVDDYNQSTPAVGRTYDGLKAFLLQAEPRHNGSLIQLARANPLIAQTETDGTVPVVDAPTATALATNSGEQPPSKPKALYCFTCGYGRFSGRQCNRMHDSRSMGILKAPFTEDMANARSHLDGTGKHLELLETDVNNKGFYFS